MALVLQREKKIKILIFYSLQRNEDFVHFLSCIQFLYKRTFLSDEQIYYHILHVTATTVNHPEFESGAHAFYPSSLFWEGEFRWREESFSPPLSHNTPSTSIVTLLPNCKVSQQWSKNRSRSDLLRPDGRKISSGYRAYERPRSPGEFDWMIITVHEIL